MKKFYGLAYVLLLLFSLQTASAQCDLDASSGSATDVGGGDCSYTGTMTIGTNLPGGDSQNGNSIEIFVNGTSVFSTNCNPCEGQTYNFNFTAPCGSVASFSFDYEGNGNNQCSATPVDLALGTLPVSLKNFTAAQKDKNVLLSWETSQELNNRGFELTRSDNGIDFKVVGFVAGKGDSNRKNKYSIEDIIPNSGLYYYALKQIDYNGFEKRYETISIDVFSREKKAQVYPNPITDQVFNVRSNYDGEMNIVNQIGKTVFTSFFQEGENEINLSGVTSGLYILNFPVEGQLHESKIIFIK